jgi:multicomponent Na+:H+ antiporter subunit E
VTIEQADLVRWQLPSGLPRVFMANAVSLLPGTLSAELHKECLRVHMLDETSDFTEELKVLEKRVAGVSGLELVGKERSEV